MLPRRLPRVAAAKINSARRALRHITRGAGQRRNDSKINRSSVNSAPRVATASATAAAAIAGFHPSATSAAFAWELQIAASSLLGRCTPAPACALEVVARTAPLWALAFAIAHVTSAAPTAPARVISSVTSAAPPALAPATEVVAWGAPTWARVLDVVTSTVPLARVLDVVAWTVPAFAIADLATCPGRWISRCSAVPEIVSVPAWWD
jgi:hypothetical protein